MRDIAALTTVEVVESTTIEKGNDFGWLNWARGDRVFMFVVAKIGALLPHRDDDERRISRY